MRARTPRTTVSPLTRGDSWPWSRAASPLPRSWSATPPPPWSPSPPRSCRLSSGRPPTPRCRSCPGRLPARQPSVSGTAHGPGSATWTSPGCPVTLSSSARSPATSSLPGVTIPPWTPSAGSTFGGSCTSEARSSASTNSSNASSTRASTSSATKARSSHGAKSSASLPWTSTKHPTSTSARSAWAATAACPTGASTARNAGSGHTADCAGA